MPPGFSARCAACSSPHRPEIDKRLLSGESTRTVSAWLLEQGDRVSYVALANHKREHLAVAEMVAELAAQAAPAFDEAVQEGLTRIQLLEEQSHEMRDMRRLAAEWIRQSMTSEKTPSAPPMAVVVLLSSSASEMRQSVAQLQKVLGEEAVPPGADDNDLARRIIEDVELSRLAHDFLERAAEGDPRGDGIRAEWAQVAPSEAPPPAE